MALYCRRKSRHNHSHDEIGHGKQPWVYFMVDSFFLITAFFVATFQVRSTDLSLPNPLSMQGQGPGPKIISSEKVSIHISAGEEKPVYLLNSRPLSMEELSTVLSTARREKSSFNVSVSYERNVPFFAVMAVFNMCAKYDLGKCSLIPTR